MPVAPTQFIVGVGRSGTTLLRMMLDAHPELAIPAETHFLNDVLALDVNDSAKERFFRTVTEAYTWPNFALDRSAFRDALDSIAPFSIPDATRAFYRCYAKRFGKTRWGDKTPSYRASMTGIGRLLPEARFIHIIRDGRDVALSYRGLWFGPGDDVELQARFWVEQIELARAQSSELQHYLEVRYEALVQVTEPTLRTICDYLDLPFQPVMMDYHKSASARLSEIKNPSGPPTQAAHNMARFVEIHDRTKEPPDPGRIGRWRTEMLAEDARRYEMIAGELLHRLGYETKFRQ
jgi:Sulfotransferase family